MFGMKDAIARLLDYDHWANREDIARLRTATHAPRSATEVMAHLIATEWLWLTRLRGEPQKMSVWPAFSLDSCAAQLEPLPNAWKEFLAKADLDDEIHYTNTRGEKWTSKVADVLWHVPLHGSYHRGQIAMLIRSGGDEPVYTDYIQCTRAGLI